MGWGLVSYGPSRKLRDRCNAMGAKRAAIRDLAGLFATNVIDHDMAVTFGIFLETPLVVFA